MSPKKNMLENKAKTFEKKNDHKVSSPVKLPVGEQNQDKQKSYKY